MIHIRVSTQVIEHFRTVATALGVPQNKIHVQGTMVGGGFGGKEDITVEVFLGLLTKHTGRPVRLVYTREESITAHSKRHPFIISHRTGVKKNGLITAAEIDMIADSGGYPYLSAYVLLYAGVTACGPYRVENLRVNGVAVATNNPFTSAFRGFGSAQACVAYEQQMDEIAKALSLDSLEVRRVNYLRTGDRNSTGQTVETAALLEESARLALQRLGEQTLDHGPVLVGRGFASYSQSYGRITWLHDTSSAWVGVELDGSVVVRASTLDIGAGQISTLGQIVAEVLGVCLEDVTVYSMDSALTPLAGTTTATRQTCMSGNAVLQASREVRSVLLRQAASHFEEEEGNLDLAGGRAFVKNKPQDSLSLADLAAMCARIGLPLSNLGMFKAPFTDPIDEETGQGRVFPDATYGAQAVEVAVDTETGEISILKSVACHDVGRAINPTAVVGQIQGGSAQGFGYALMEEVVVKDGLIQTPSLAEYLLPTACDFPATEAIILESGTGLGPFGSQGIGEPSLTPAAAAVANADADAIGVRINRLPITPWEVLQALDRAGDALDTSV